MLLTPESFQFECGCGQSHEVRLKRALIAPGALLQLDTLRAETGLTGTAAAIYDQNTYAATAGRHPAAEQEIILSPENLHADEKATGEVLAQLGDVDMLIAMGSGTIHDITRYCAKQRGIPFIAAPTAASVDGFVSDAAAMTWRGYKKSMPGVSPPLLVADIDVISKAPWRLTCAGVGDLLGKYNSLTEWKIAHLLTGEQYCDGIDALTLAAVDEAMASYNHLESGNPEAFAGLMKGLILSGVAMQLAGNTRPASGAEHHISHIMELGLSWLPDTGTLHGERVGVASLLVAEEYHKFAGISDAELIAMDPAKRVERYRTPTAEELAPVYEALTEEVLKENENDCFFALPPLVLEERWPEVKALLKAAPKAETVADVLRTLGAKCTLADLGLDESLREKILFWSPYIRNRLTIMRILHVLRS